MEPNITTFGGLFSPATGIISAHGLMDYFHHAATEHGACVQLRCTVVGLEKLGDGWTVQIDEAGQRSSFTSEWVVNAAGLESDTIASYAGIDVDAAGYRVHYCKGSYFSLPASMNGCISRLVYPTPTKHSLGVHALMDLGGRLKFGPDVEYLPDRRLDYTVAESKKRAFAESVRRILPFVKDEELTPDMSGIRPKVQAQGETAKDFIIRHERDRGLEGLIDLIGIESPGLTASPAIARAVRELMEA
jgi:L-2-hydroxyglutarate oxidase LhgO